MCNGPKRIIFARSELTLLQMVSELDTGRCTSKDVAPLKEMNCEISN